MFLGWTSYGRCFTKSSPWAPAHLQGPTKLGGGIQHLFQHLFHHLLTWWGGDWRGCCWCSGPMWGWAASSTYTGTGSLGRGVLLKSRVGTVIARRGGVAEGKELASYLQILGRRARLCYWTLGWVPCRGRTTGRWFWGESSVGTIMSLGFGGPWSL